MGDVTRSDREEDIAAASPEAAAASATPRRRPRTAAGGPLSLRTDVPGVEVSLYRHAAGPRATPTFVRALGQTPITEPWLPAGSYLCVLSAAARCDVRYPVVIQPRSRDTSSFVVMPERGAISEREIYVPAGDFWAGEAEDLGRERWLDALVFDRSCVTNARYLDFLNALVARGGHARAERFAPHPLELRGGGVRYERDARGAFVLRTDAIDPDRAARFPVVMVDWHSATAYAAWRASRTGQPWRLPRELEWEKVARGVDARTYPWGPVYRPAWCRGQRSPQLRPAEVGSYPTDESPYGARDLGGNCQEWCAERFEMDDDRAVRRTLPLFRAIRGGSWLTGATHAQTTHRGGLCPDLRRPDRGFRLGRSL